MKQEVKITVIGAGNVGTQIATHCAEKGYDVIVYTSKAEKISKWLTVINERDEVIHQGVIKKATKDSVEAFKNTDIIFVTVPAMLMKETAKKIEPFAGRGMYIGIIPGTGGGECAFKGCVEKGATIFGVQRVPSVARLVEYGKIVRAIGYRKEMFVAAIPNRETQKCCDIVEDIVGIRTTAASNYLNITLTPSNPILHTTRLKNLFEDWHKGVVYTSVPLFYEEWNDETSILLLKCDDEIQEICRRLQPFDLTSVKSLRIHYESPTANLLTKKIRSIDGFKGLPSPTIKVRGGYIPDFSSRYFTADFSYGLSILLQIAKFVEYDAPNMKETLEWYHSLAGAQEEYQFSDFGINNCDEFIEFYLQ